MGDIRSGNGDPGKWDRMTADHVKDHQSHLDKLKAKGDKDRDKPVMTATQVKTRDMYADMQSNMSAHMSRMLNKSVFGRYRDMDKNQCAYFVFDKRTKDYEECKDREEASEVVEAWLDQGGKMEDIAVYDVDGVFVIKPAPGFKMEVETADDAP